MYNDWHKLKLFKEYHTVNVQSKKQGKRVIFIYIHFRFDGPRGGGGGGGGRPPPNNGYQPPAPQHNAPPSNGYGPPS